MARVVGFYDVDRVTTAVAAELERNGFRPVLGNPRDVVIWRTPWWERLLNWLTRRTA